MATQLVLQFFIFWQMALGVCYTTESGAPKNLTLAIPVLKETVILQPKGSAAARVAIDLSLPQGTDTFVYRITILNISESEFSPHFQSLFTQLRSNKTLFVQPNERSRIDFYILKSKAVQHYLQKGEIKTGSDLYASVLKSKGVLDAADAPLQRTSIALQNPNPKSAVKAVVEVVAYGLFPGR